MESTNLYIHLMSAREWRAAILFVAQLAVSAWLVTVAPAHAGETTAAAATALRAIAYAIVLTIIANIAAGIALGMVRQSMQEPADERDRLINLQSTRNAYFVL